MKELLVWNAYLLLSPKENPQLLNQLLAFMAFDRV
jgi:hypothetical protein